MKPVLAPHTIALALASMGLVPVQAADSVVPVHLGPPRLQEFVQAGKDDAVKDAKNGLLRVYYCNTPGFHPPPALEAVAREEKDMKVLRERFGIYVAWPSADPTSIDGTIYVCPYVQVYNCSMLEQVRLKHGVEVARHVHAFGLPCK